jgi:hypothetical protein
MSSVRSQKVDLGVEFSTTGGGMLLMDEYSCSVLAMTIESKPVVVRFLRCMQVKFGYPNDEALIGDELYGDCSYGVYEVIGSGWFDALQEKNRVVFPGVTWLKKRHFALIFHESMGEFLADDVRVEVFDGGFDETALETMRWALVRQETSSPSLLPHPET